MLELQSLVSGYGAVPVLDKVSIQVGAREIVSVIGANGAGKTTLLLTISGVLPCWSGRKIFNGHDITRQRTERLVGMGLVQVPEGRQVFGALTVYENLVLGAYSRRREFGKGKITERFDFVFSLFPILRERRQQLSSTLSGGEQQMLALGRALMAEPEILLLDEPSSGLAPLVVEEISEVLKRLNGEGLPILLVEQNAVMALSLAHRAYVLENGRAVLEGPAEKLAQDKLVQQIYLGVTKGKQ